MTEEPQTVTVTNAGQPVVVVITPFQSVFSYEAAQGAVVEFPDDKTVIISPS